jgi:hypothetical protein
MLFICLFIYLFIYLFMYVVDEKHLSYWFPILTGLSKIASHSIVDVRET